MTSQLNNILPDKLLKTLKKSDRIYLSVNPIIAFSDVLLALEGQLSHGKEAIEIVSGDNLARLNEINGDQALIACGGLSLKEMPSYIRENIHKEQLENITEAISGKNWILVSVKISNVNAFNFEYLSSSCLDETGINLSDHSWTSIPFFNNRFANIKTESKFFYAVGQFKSQVIPDLKKIDDFEFLE